jgi:nitrogen regulatory protein P-II 1
MSFLVVMIIDNPDDCPRVLEAWREVGVNGATILESTGMGRLIGSGLRDDLPLIPSLSSFLEMREEPHRTVFSVVKEQSTVDQMVTAAQTIIGDLNKPHTGILFVLPVLQVYGLDRNHA